MATKGKKQTTKKKGSGSSTRVSKTRTSQTKKAAAKKPASFSKAPEKSLKESEKPADTSKAPEKNLKESEKFAEFETLNIKIPKAETKSKIIVRDVAKEDKEIEEKKARIEKIEEIKNVEPEEAKIEEPKAEVEKSKPKIEIELPKKVTKKSQINTPAPKITAKEIKEKEITKAIKAANTIEGEKPKHKKSFFGNFGLARAILVVVCASTIAFCLIYFINLASTDMSIKVAAMQSGIDASYPSYIPRGYSITDVSSSNGKIVMRFKKDDGDFEIIEENSNWDSDALLNNYIREKYGDDYTVIREQGLTLFMGDNWEAWVNGGVLYKLNITSGSLTKKQMRTIAASF